MFGTWPVTNEGQAVESPRWGFMQGDDDRHRICGETSEYNSLAAVYYVVHQRWLVKGLTITGKGNQSIISNYASEGYRTRTIHKNEISRSVGTKGGKKVGAKAREKKVISQTVKSYEIIGGKRNDNKDKICNSGGCTRKGDGGRGKAWAG